MTSVVDNMVDVEKLTLRQIHAQDTKRRIYDAAIQLLEEKEFSEISIQDITSRAGVAKGSFYSHFKSKEDLVCNYTYIFSDEYYWTAYEEIKDLPFLEAITRFAQAAYSKIELQGKGVMRALSLSYSADNFTVRYSKNRVLLKCMREMIETAKANGEISQDKNTDDCVNVLLVALIGAETVWCFRKDMDNLPHLVGNAVYATARGLMCR